MKSLAQMKEPSLREIEKTPLKWQQYKTGNVACHANVSDLFKVSVFPNNKQLIWNRNRKAIYCQNRVFLREKKKVKKIKINCVPIKPCNMSSYRGFFI